METAYIKYFLSVARCLSFSQAAEENNISQSALSKAIMRLERELGCKLIDRRSHPVSLTQAGTYFFERMSSLEPVYNEAMDHLRSIASEGTLRIRYYPNSYKYRTAFASYAECNADLKLQWEGAVDYNDAASAALSGKYDFVICNMPLQLPDGLRMTEICADELYLLATDTYAFADRDSVSLRELNGLNFIESPYSRSIMMKLTELFEFVPGKVFPPEGENVRREELIYMIALGKGVGIYTGRDLRSFSADGRNQLRIIPIKEVPSLPVVLLERESAAEPPARARLRTWILENFESYLSERLDLEEFNTHGRNKRKKETPDDDFPN